MSKTKIAIQSKDIQEHASKWKAWFWRASGWFIIIESPFICGPQVWLIIENESSRDVSLLTWASSAASSAVWALHANRVRDRVMQWASWTWAVSNMLVLLIACAYRWIM